MKMNIAISFLLILLLFLLIAQPTDISLHPFRIAFKHLGYGLGIIFITIGILFIHAEARLNAIKEYTTMVKESLKNASDLTDEEFESVWMGEKTFDEINTSKAQENGNEHHNKD